MTASDSLPASGSSGSDPLRASGSSGSDPLRASGSSAISRDEVAHLARLARLALTDDELDGYVGQLGAILGHVSQIGEVSTEELDEVEATSSPLDAVNVTRPDAVADCLTADEALEQAPRVVDGQFAVPQILGEE